jgi:NAD dependent epimerase/dehydratase family enzyme
MFIAAIENESMVGVYNGVAPHPVDNKTMMKGIASALNRPLLPFHVPASGLKLAMGEMADMVLGGSRISARKIMDTGFTFKFPDLNTALKDLLN